MASQLPPVLSVEAGEAVAAVAVVLLPSLLATQAKAAAASRRAPARSPRRSGTIPIRDLLFDEAGELRSLVNVYVDGVDAHERGGLEAPLRARRRCEW